MAEFLSDHQVREIAEAIGLRVGEPRAKLREAIEKALNRAPQEAAPLSSYSEKPEWAPEDYKAAHAAIREHAGFAVACDALDAVAYRLQQWEDSERAWWKSNDEKDARIAELEAQLASIEPLDEHILESAQTVVKGGIADYDPVSIDCAQELLRRFSPATPKEETVDGVLAAMKAVDPRANDLSLREWADRIEAARQTEANRG